MPIMIVASIRYLRIVYCVTLQQAHSKQCMIGPANYILVPTA